MKRFVSALFAAPVALLALNGCSLTQAHETVHRRIDSGAAPVVHVSNAVGTVRITGWTKPSVDVTARKSGHSLSDLHNIKIDVHEQGAAIFVSTNYSGFMTSGGVSYTIRVPADASLDVRNETGSIDIAGVRGSVTAKSTTGRIAADLGTVAGNRAVDLGVTTGSVHLTIARDSSATVDANTSVGGFKSDFPGVTQNRQNVGASASGRIGSGSGKIRLTVTTGGISLLSAG